MIADTVCFIYKHTTNRITLLYNYYSTASLTSDASNCNESKAMPHCEFDSYATGINKIINVTKADNQTTPFRPTDSAASVAFGFILGQRECLASMSVSILHAVPTLFDGDLSLAEHVEYILRDPQERFLNILTSHSRRLNEPHVVEVSELFALLCRDDALGLLVGLVSDHHVDGAARLDVELGLGQPVLEVLEARPLTDVVDE